MNRGTTWLLAACVLIGAATWQSSRLANTVIPLPVLYTLGGDLSLSSTRSDITTLSQLEGGLVLLNFGYTGCPDVCPTALARMREVITTFAELGASITPVFVTLDPDRDTLDRLTPYLGFFGPSFIGMTGSTEEIAAATSAYKVFYEKQPMASAMEYGISHSSHIYLLDREGKVRATFGEGVPLTNMIETVQALLAETG